LRPQAKFLELAHRLDKETSGCLIIAKKRSALNALHEMFRGDGMQKTYLALLAGNWQRKKLVVTQPLLKNVADSGERMVVISTAGKAAETLFRRMEQFKDSTLVEASPKTGRTHQIRVHAAWLGHPIIGDDRYGEAQTNQAFKKRGYKRLFLHALRLTFPHPLTGEVLNMQAPLPKILTDLLNHERSL
jgi:23S rRNA pseudouridine955/2504/2580 synthase